MSNQRTLEQDRAKKAWDCVHSGVKQDPSKDFRDKYGSLASKAPADIQANGLGQTLAFWRAKGKEKDGKEPSAENKAHRQLLQDVTEWLKSEKSLGLVESDLVQWISNKATVNDYRRATTETIAFLAWLKRFAEAELP